MRCIKIKGINMLRHILTALCVLTFFAPDIAHSQTPQNQVGNTDFKMFSAVTAESANEFYQRGLQAAADCDERGVFYSQESLSRLSEKVDDYGNTISDIFESIAQGLYRDPDHEDADTISGMIRDLQAKLLACKKKREEKAIKIAMGVFAGVMRNLGIHGYLGAEQAGVPASRELGVVDQSSQASIVGVEATVKVLLDAAKDVLKKAEEKRSSSSTADFFLGVQQAKADNSQGLSDFSTSGRNLLLPGVGAGPNPTGFTIGAANSDVTNISFIGEHSFFAYEFGFGNTFHFPQSGATVRPFVGAEYGRSNSNMVFSGTTNAGGTNFAYRTDVDNQYIAPIIGVEASMPSRILTNFLGVPTDIEGTARYAHAFNHAEGSDTLEVTGFTPGTTDLTQSQNTSDVKAGVVITVHPTNFFIF